MSAPRFDPLRGPTKLLCRLAVNAVADGNICNCLVWLSPTLESHEGRRFLDRFALGYDGIGRKVVIRPAQSDTLHDHLIVRDPGMLAHDGGLHDPLAVDHGTKPPRPGRVDERGRHGATVEGRIVTGRKPAIVCDDHADRRVELAKAAQDPFLPLLLVISRNSHGAEQLLGNANLTFAMHSLEWLAGSKLARVRNSRQIALGIALANTIQ